MKPHKQKLKSKNAHIATQDPAPVSAEDARQPVEVSDVDHFNWLADALSDADATENKDKFALDDGAGTRMARLNSTHRVLFHHTLRRLPEEDEDVYLARLLRQLAECRTWQRKWHVLGMAHLMRIGYQMLFEPRGLPKSRERKSWEKETAHRLGLSVAKLQEAMTLVERNYEIQAASHSFLGYDRDPMDR